MAKTAATAVAGVRPSTPMSFNSLGLRYVRTLELIEQWPAKIDRATRKQGDAVGKELADQLANFEARRDELLAEMKVRWSEGERFQLAGRDQLAELSDEEKEQRKTLDAQLKELAKTFGDGE